MKTLKQIAVASLAAILIGCSSTNTPQQNISEGCVYYQLVYTTYMAVVASGAIPDSEAIKQATAAATALSTTCGWLEVNKDSRAFRTDWYGVPFLRPPSN